MACDETVAIVGVMRELGTQGCTVEDEELGPETLRPIFYEMLCCLLPQSAKHHIPLPVNLLIRCLPTVSMPSTKRNARNT